MYVQENNKKIQIVESAKSIFVKKGFEGARMQEIADNAGVNKALIHYYFGSKNKLFLITFIEICNNFFPQLFDVIKSATSLKHLIKDIVSVYMDFLINNPHFPSFILHELHSNPNGFGDTMMKGSVDLVSLPDIFNEKMKNDNIREIETNQLIVNIISLCVLPFLAQTMIQSAIFNNNLVSYEIFLKNRKEEITDFILKTLK